MINPTTLLSDKEFLHNHRAQPVKVLLVDDKKENLFSLEKLLEDDEYKIQFIKCTSGNEALNIALKEDFALILLDVQMPEMDGYEVARYLKQNKKTSSTPLIFVTALDHEVNYILEGYKKGAVDYLFKPLNPAITRAKVHAFIQNHFQQKELEQKNITLQNLAMLVNNSIDLMCILDGSDLSVMKLNPAWEKHLGLENDQVLGHSVNNLPGALNEFSLLEESKDQVVIFENTMASTTGDLQWFNWSFVKKNNLWYGNGKNITKSKLVEQQLEKAKEELENKVNERTADLLILNQQLKKEIKKRSQAESELKKYNERLVKANEELDSFVYVASHDLKAPISNIETLLMYIRNKIEGKLSEDEINMLNLISSSIAKFNITLKDLGRIISVEKDLEEDYNLIDFKSVIEDVKADIKNLIKENNAQITVDLKVEKIFYSHKNLRSIIYNLLSNAIKYRSPERTPEIYIETSEKKGQIILKVKDNGLGLSNTQKEKMFSMFKRFHNHVDGSGIGLYLLKKIIENSGGKVELESCEGLGSEFTVYFKKFDTNLKL